MLSNTKPLSMEVRKRIVSLLEDALSTISKLEAQCAEMHVLIDECAEFNEL